MASSYGDPPSTSHLSVDDSPTASTSAASNQGKAIKRTRTGCLVCRKRKVKCDERPGTCAACERIHAACEWDEPWNAEKSSSEARKRPRAKKACAQCRSVRMKCSTDRPRCARCQRKSFDCHYEADVSNSFDSGTELGGELSRPFEMAELGDKATVTSLIDGYFQNYYPSAYHSFLHRPTIMRDYEEGKLDKRLLISMCAVTVRLTTPDAPTSSRWFEAIFDSVASSLVSKPTFNLVCTAIHLLSFVFWDTQNTRVFMLCSLVCRAVFALRLNLESNHDEEASFAERESRRRVAFASFLIDSFVAGGVREFSSLPSDSLHIQLPTTERNFNLSIACKCPQLTLSVEGRIEASPLAPNVGLLGHYITVMAIRRRILQYVVNIERDSSLPWQEQSLFHLCRTDIMVWEIGLGSEYNFTKENLHARKASGQLNQLFALRVYGHQATVNLCRIAIHGFREAAKPEVLLAAPPDWLWRTQRDCFDSAIRVLDTAQFVLGELPDFVCSDSGVCAALFESTRIQIWSLFHLVEPENRQAAVQEAIPRIEAAVLLMTRTAGFAYNVRGMLHMMARLLRSSPFASLAPTFSESGASTPSGDYPSLVAPSKHELIIRVHSELAQVAKEQQRQNPKSTEKAPPSASTSSIMAAGTDAPPASPRTGTLQAVEVPLALTGDSLEAEAASWFGELGDDPTNLWFEPPTDLFSFGLDRWPFPDDASWPRLQ
ncbi:hypothetical protein BCR35DRAFT_303194 [Leucosporidium creatinivorum]|uniref:Zn(2)-C6 fungal-type domain-containing protein n=1 Tax=Leucosporidium creatinivorum TaxID=106004 RepID=A0A1Y2FJM0_9BASI|nr:hypothetical protein BCR35DRAFT_303194 [Leucosporidium creatinivorum]